MPVIGSSSVVMPASVAGPMGLTGPIGITGYGGASGPTGPTGSTGATGSYVVSGYPDDINLVVVLSDGREITIENIHGPTGAYGDAGGLTGIGGNNPYAIFKEVTDGITFWFKGLTTGTGAAGGKANNSLSMYVTDNSIGISGNKQPQRGATTDAMVRGRFVYLSDANIADSTALIGTTSGQIGFNNQSSYDTEETVIPMGPLELKDSYGNIKWYGITGSDYSINPFGPTAGDGIGIQLVVDRGTVHKIETPIGIHGFTGSFSSDEIFSFNMHLKGNDIWDWPENVYFDKTDLYFSCGWDIVNFLTDDGGESWKANIAVRGYGTSDCESVHGLGSCCYIDLDGQHKCQDYTTKEECSNPEFGSPFDTDGDGIPDGDGGYWSAFATCAENCGMDASGVCCSEGGEWGNFGGETRICLENVGAAECDYFGGAFWTYYYYGQDEFGRPIPLETPIPIECDSGKFFRDHDGDYDDGSCRNESELFEYNDNDSNDPIGCCCVPVGIPKGGHNCCDHTCYETPEEGDLEGTNEGGHCWCDYTESECMYLVGTKQIRHWYEGKTCQETAQIDGWGVCCYGCETNNRTINPLDPLSWDCDECVTPYCDCVYSHEDCFIDDPNGPGDKCNKYPGSSDPNETGICGWYDPDYSSYGHGWNCLFSLCRYGHPGVDGHLCPAPEGKSPGDSAYIFPEETKSQAACEASTRNGVGGKWSPLTFMGSRQWESRTCDCPLDDEPSGSGHGYCSSMVKCCDENLQHVGYKWDWETTGCAEYFGVDDAVAGQCSTGGDPLGACCCYTDPTDIGTFYACDQNTNIGCFHVDNPGATNPAPCVYRGPDTVCCDCLGNPESCSPTDPEGACCWGNNNTSCDFTTAYNCSQLEGIYAGDGSSCSGDACDENVPTGACCIGTNCSVIKSSTCYLAGGSYRGDNTSCSADTCDDVPPGGDLGSCCMCSQRSSGGELKDRSGRNQNRGGGAYCMDESQLSDYNDDNPTEIKGCCCHTTGEFGGAPNCCDHYCVDDDGVGHDGTNHGAICHCDETALECEISGTNPIWHGGETCGEVAENVGYGVCCYGCVTVDRSVDGSGIPYDNHWECGCTGTYPDFDCSGNGCVTPYCDCLYHSDDCLMDNPNGKGDVCTPECKLADGTCLHRSCRYSEIGGLCPPIDGKSPGDSAEVFPEVTKSATLCEASTNSNGAAGKYSPLTWHTVFTWESSTCFCPLDDEPSGSGHGYCTSREKCCDAKGQHVGYKWPWEPTGCAEYFDVDDDWTCGATNTGACCCYNDMQDQENTFVSCTQTPNSTCDCTDIPDGGGWAWQGAGSECCDCLGNPESCEPGCGAGPACTGGQVCCSGVCLDSCEPGCGTGPACTGGQVCCDGNCQDSCDDGECLEYSCILEITSTDCAAMSGLWNEDGECIGDCADDSECSNMGLDLCISPCCSSVACCKDGTCIADSTGAGNLPPISQVICEYVYGGTAIEGRCGEVDCCDSTIYVGACCINNVCNEMTFTECSNGGGIFMGPSSSCEGDDAVICNCGSGACCMADNSCSEHADEFSCIDVGGIWQGIGSNCDDTSCVPPEGACCLGDECVVVTQDDCSSQGGRYQGDNSDCCAGVREKNKKKKKSTPSKINRGDTITEHICFIIDESGSVSGVGGLWDSTLAGICAAFIGPAAVFKDMGTIIVSFVKFDGAGTILIDPRELDTDNLTELEAFCSDVSSYQPQGGSTNIESAFHRMINDGSPATCTNDCTGFLWDEIAPTKIIISSDFYDGTSYGLADWFRDGTANHPNFTRNTTICSAGMAPIGLGNSIMHAKNYACTDDSNHFLNNNCNATIAINGGYKTINLALVDFPDLCINCNSDVDPEPCCIDGTCYQFNPIICAALGGYTVDECWMCSQEIGNCCLIELGCSAPCSDAELEYPVCCFADQCLGQMDSGDCIQAGGTSFENACCSCIDPAGECTCCENDAVISVCRDLARYECECQDPCGVWSNEDNELCEGEDCTICCDANAGCYQPGVGGCGMDGACDCGCEQPAVDCCLPAGVSPCTDTACCTDTLTYCACIEAGGLTPDVLGCSGDPASCDPQCDPGISDCCCNQPLGACCYTAIDGGDSCTVTSEAGCELLLGEWQGEGTDCSDPCTCGECGTCCLWHHTQNYIDCIENITETLCHSYGTEWVDWTAGDWPCCNDQDEPQCIYQEYHQSPNCDPGACCLSVSPYCKMVDSEQDCMSETNWAGDGSWQGHGCECGTDCAEDCAAVTGACCIDGVCSILSEKKCGAGWQGEGTDCDPINNYGHGRCGVCCERTTGSGTCQQCTFADDKADCESLPGAKWHPHADGFPAGCSPIPCVQPGACCRADGTCDDYIYADDCDGIDEIWHQCDWCTDSHVDCDVDPLGSCCYIDPWPAKTHCVLCVEVIEDDCPDPTDPQDGLGWLQGGTCSPNICAEDTGACCHEDESCSLEYQADCVSPSVWNGCKWCTEVDCNTTYGRCCLGGTCYTNKLSQQCIDQGGDWDDSNTCNNVTCPDQVCCKDDGITCDPTVNWGSCTDGTVTTGDCDDCNFHEGVCCDLSYNCWNVPEEIDEADCDGTYTPDALLYCETYDCPTPLGACCYTNEKNVEVCQNLAQNVCELKVDYHFYGKNTTCKDEGADCGEGDGACCLFGECFDNTPESDCDEGTYYGDDSSCVPHEYECTGECKTDQHCPDAQVCCSEVCQDSCDGGCKNSSDCPNAQVCCSGVCQDSCDSTTGACCIINAKDPSIYDCIIVDEADIDQCDANWQGAGSTCAADGSTCGDATGKCTDSSDCPGQVCCSGVCQDSCGGCVVCTCLDSAECPSGEYCCEGSCETEPCEVKGCGTGPACTGGENCCDGDCYSSPCCGTEPPCPCQKPNCCEGICQSAECGDPCKENINDCGICCYWNENTQETECIHLLKTTGHLKCQSEYQGYFKSNTTDCADCPPSCETSCIDYDPNDTHSGCKGACLKRVWNGWGTPLCEEGRYRGILDDGGLITCFGEGLNNEDDNPYYDPNDPDLGLWHKCKTCIDIADEYCNTYPDCEGSCCVPVGIGTCDESYAECAYFTGNSYMPGDPIPDSDEIATKQWCDSVGGKFHLGEHRSACYSTAWEEGKEQPCRRSSDCEGFCCSETDRPCCLGDNMWRTCRDNFEGTACECLNTIPAPPDPDPDPFRDVPIGYTNIQLPSGECVYMRCEPPECPYPICKN